MEYIRTVKVLYDVFITKVLKGIGKIIETLNSTVPNIIQENIGENAPGWLKTILDFYLDLLDRIPVLGTTTLFEYIIGIGFNAVIAIIVIKFFAKF